MKMKFLIFLTTWIPIFLDAQIPNGGFENWTNMGIYGNPDQWGNMNDYTASAGIFTCTKGSPGNPGSAYLKLTSTNIAGMGIVPGIAVSGILNTTTLQPVSGFSYTGRPESLTGNWQFMAYGSDQGYISVLLTKWSPDLHIRDTVARAYHPLEGMVMSWRNFSIPLEYQSCEASDSVIIIASASNATGAMISDHSYLYLDNLSLYGTTGVEDPGRDAVLRLFPSPVKQTLYVSISGLQDGPGSLEIYNLEGQKLITLDYDLLSGTLPVDVGQLPEGCYILKILSGKETFCRKFARLK
jgi:hypothetical protein